MFGSPCGLAATPTTDAMTSSSVCAPASGVGAATAAGAMSSFARPVKKDSNLHSGPTTAPQTRPRVVEPRAEEPRPGEEVVKADDVVKVDVDLVVLDALVLQKKTGRVVGGLKREDFASQAH